MSQSTPEGNGEQHAEAAADNTPDAAPEVADAAPAAGDAAPAAGDAAPAAGDAAPEAGDAKSVATTEVTQPGGAHLDKKRTIIGAVVTLVILAFVFSSLANRFGSFSEAWAKIQVMSFVALASLVIVAVVNILVYPFPFQVAIPGLKYRPGFVTRQTSWMVAALVPAGGAFALALQYAMLASYRISSAAATSGIAITSVWSFFMTFLLPVLGVLAIATSGELQAAWIWSGVAGLTALVVTIVVFWLILRSEKNARKIGAIGQKIAAPVLRRFHKEADITESILSFREQVVDVVKAHWIMLTVTNLVVSLMQFMLLFVAIRGVAPDSASQVSIAEVFAAFAISRLGTLVPLTPGGLGTVAGALGVMLAAFGMSQSDILAAVLVWQVVQLLPQAITGIVTLLYWRVHEGRQRKAEQVA